MSRSYMLGRRHKAQPKQVISAERTFELLRRPVVTEKSTFVGQFNQYVFQVAIDATKTEVKAAVEELFKVNVKAVNTVVTKGKVKRFRGKVGKRSDVKKAYVTLAPGQIIDTSVAV